MDNPVVMFCYDWNQGNNGSRFCTVPFYLAGVPILKTIKELESTLDFLKEAEVSDDSISVYKKEIDWRCLLTIDALELAAFLPPELFASNLTEMKLNAIPTFVKTKTGTHMWVFITTGENTSDKIVSIIQWSWRKS